MRLLFLGLSILAAAVPASLSSIRRVHDIIAQSLSGIFDVDLWPDATHRDISTALSNISKIDAMVVYDVGQVKNWFTV